MRLRSFTLYICLALTAGCSESVGERKTAVPMDKVPADLIKIAQDKYPDITFESAFTEIEGGTPVYELKGKSKTGKIYEVEVTKDGKILHAK